MKQYGQHSIKVLLILFQFLAVVELNGQDTNYLAKIHAYFNKQSCTSGGLPGLAHNAYFNPPGYGSANKYYTEGNLSGYDFSCTGIYYLDNLGEITAYPDFARVYAFHQSGCNIDNTFDMELNQDYQQSVKTLTSSKDHATGYIVLYAEIHPLKEINSMSRYLEVNSDLYANIILKDRSMHGSFNYNNTSPTDLGVNDNQIYSIKLQVRYASENKNESAWRDLYYNVYSSKNATYIPYNTIRAAFNNANILGVECQMRLIQSLGGESFVTVPKSFTYLDRLTLSNVNYSNTSCFNIEDGSISFQINKQTNTSVDYVWDINILDKATTTSQGNPRVDGIEYNLSSSRELDTDYGTIASTSDIITVPQIPKSLTDQIYELVVYTIDEDEELYPAKYYFKIVGPDPITVSANPNYTWEYGGTEYNIPTGSNSAPLEITAVGGTRVNSNDYYFTVNNIPVTGAKTSPYTHETQESTTSFEVKVEDANGCSTTTAVDPFIYPPSITNISISNLQAVSCNVADVNPDADGTKTNGKATINFSGGIPNYTIALINEEGDTVKKAEGLSATSHTFTGLSVGDYKVKIKDGTGVNWFPLPSENPVTFKIDEPDSIEINNIDFSDINCYGETSDATLTGSGGKIGSSYTYNYRTGSNSFQTDSNGIAPNLQPGTSYDFYASNQFGCQSPTITSSTPPAKPKIEPTFTTTPASCGLADNGTATISVSGGTPKSYGYDVYINSSTKEGSSMIQFDGLLPKTYSLLITDSLNCTVDTTITITHINDSLSISGMPIISDESCTNLENGRITVNIDKGGIPATNYTYSLYNGITLVQDFSNISAISQIFHNVGADNYTLVVKGSDGCKATELATVNVSSNSLKWANTNYIGTENADCPGSETGLLWGTAENGFIGSTYRYTLEADSYNESIFTNGTANFEDLLGELKYTLTVTDDSSCSISDTISVLASTNPVELSLINKQDQICTNYANGLYQVSASTKPGNSILEITQNFIGIDTVLSTSNTASSRTDLKSGFYLLEASDNAGCSDTMGIRILNLEDNPMVQTLNYDSVACYTASNGIIEIESSQKTKTSDYTFNFEGLTRSNISNTIYSNLTAGDYNLTVSDDVGCSSDTLITMAVINTPLEISKFDIIPTSCIRASNGRVELEAIGSMSANPEIKFILNNSDTIPGVNAIFTGQPYAGSSQVIVSDKFGCSDTTPMFSIPVLADTLFLVPDAITDASCPGYSNGIIRLNTQYGTPFSSGFRYKVFTNSRATLESDSYAAAQPELMNYGKENYFIEVSDSNNCYATTEVNVSEPVAPELIASSNYIKDKGENTGWIKANTTLGNGKYNYEFYSGNEVNAGNLLNTGVTADSSTISNLITGNYLLRIQDTAACVFWDDSWLEEYIFIPEPDTELQLELAAKKQVSCFGLSDGEFTLSGTGGWGPDYEYSTNGIDYSTTALVSDLSKNTYTYYIKDTAGVIRTATFEMTEPNLLTSSLSAISDANCFGSADGEVVLDITGGNMAYEVSADNTNWVKGSIVNGLLAGSHTLYVRDSLNCTTSILANIDQPTLMVVADTLVLGTRCLNNEGEIQATIEGGIPGYTYSWTDSDGNALNSTQSAIDSLFSGAYILHVEDAHLCPQEFTFLVSDLTDLEITSVETAPVSCWDGSDGSAEAIVSNGNPPYTISWHDNSIGNAINGLNAGTYIVTVLDDKGCQVLDNFTIGTPDSIGINIDEFEHPHCHGVNNGRISITAQGGTPDYTYNWNTGRSRDKLSSLDSGRYVLTITDAHSCVKNFSFRLDYTGGVKPDLPEELVLCSGKSYPLYPGHFQFYDWVHNGDYISTDSIIHIAEKGEYIIETQNFEGCVGYDTIMVQQSDAEMDAMLLLASEIYMNDTVVIFEASNPVPDSVDISLPELFEVIEEGDFYKMVIPMDTGMFDITLISYLNGCSDITTRNLIVSPQSERMSQFKSTSGLINSFILFPNPSDGNFNVELKLNRKLDATLRLVSLSEGSTIAIAKLEDASYHIKEFRYGYLPQGVYMLNLQVGDEIRNKTIIIH